MFLYDTPLALHNSFGSVKTMNNWQFYSEKGVIIHRFYNRSWYNLALRKL